MNNMMDMIEEAQELCEKARVSVERRTAWTRHISCATCRSCW